MERDSNTGVAALRTETLVVPEVVNPILHLRTSLGTLEEKTKKKKSKAKSNVKWEEDVVDNEHLGKKKSKICCIFHPNREFGELSDSSDDESSDESDGEGNIIPKNKPNHDDHDCCDGNHKHQKGVKRDKARPNALERQPKYENKSKVPENAT